MFTEMQRQAAERNARQQAYMDSLQKREGALANQGMSDLDRASLLFQAAGALGAPTTGTGLAPALGALGTAMAGPLSKQAEAERQRKTQLQQLQDARMKMAAEMSSGPDMSNVMQLYKAQQDAIPKMGEKERLMQGLTPEEQKKARLQALGIAPAEEKDEVKNVYVNGRQMSVIMRGGKPYDLATGQPLDPSKLAEAPDEKGELKNIIMPDKSQLTVNWRNGKPYDPVSGEPIDPARMRAVEEAARAAEIADRRDSAAAAGIPLPERDILAGIKNPKIREQQQARMLDEARRVLTTEEVKHPSSGISEDMREAQRFLDINAQHQNQTGPIVGMAPALTTPAEEMDKISIGLSRKLRQPGEGTMSNFDATQFKKAFMSRSNDYEVNRNIGTGFIATKQLELDRREFFNAYAEQNGTIQGAQSHWQKYLEANPVFDRKKSKGKTIELNEDRQGWQDFFRKEMGPRSFVRGEDGRLILDQGQRP
jgi:hypothetical protein